MLFCIYLCKDKTFMKQHIIITGGSSGIGRGIAAYFYHKGWAVLITGRNIAKLQQVKSEFPGINILKYDNLSDNDQEIVDFVKTNWDRQLDILVNNAGHVELTKLEELSENSMKQMYQSHLIGPAMLTSHCVDFLSSRKGQILNISSSHGIKAYAETSAYGSAKAALNFLTKIWALELAPLGIRVNAIAPGPTETDILNAAGFTEEIIAIIHESERKAIPLQRRGKVSDIVAVATGVLDSGSTWLTGVILPVDGGLSGS